jgi:hypothetical protein
METTTNFNREVQIQHDYSNNIHVDAVEKEKALGGTNYYLSIADIRDLSAEVNDAGVILMTYYFRKFKTPKFDFWNDDTSATALGWSKKKVQNTRQALVKANWIKRVKYTQSTTKAKTTTFFLGKDMCANIESPEEYTIRVTKESVEAARVAPLRAEVMRLLGVTDWEEALEHRDYERVSDSVLAKETQAA